MAILLKKLTEGISTIKVKVMGHSNYSDLKTMSDLSNLVTRKIMEPMKKHMNASDYAIGIHNPVMVDGSSYHEKDGHLYIYIGQFSKQWRPRILGGVDHLLKSFNIQTGTWKMESGISDVLNDRIVIPIKTLPTAADPAPEILMSGGALEKIKHLLDIDDLYYDGNIGSLSLKIPTKTLLEFITTYYSNLAAGLSPMPPSAQIRFYIKEMEKLCLWAKTNNYKVIVAN